ncbi:MAG: hypothetical protein AB1523_11725 [Bacillota bacterium]
MIGKMKSLVHCAGTHVLCQNPSFAWRGLWFFRKLLLPQIADQDYSSAPSVAGGEYHVRFYPRLVSVFSLIKISNTKRIFKG